MIAVLAGAVWLDWRMERSVRQALEENDRPEQKKFLEQNGVCPLPLTAVMVVLTSVAFIEMVRLSGGAEVLTLVLSGVFGSVMLGTAPFWGQLLPDGTLTGPDVLLLLSAIVILVFAEQMIRYRTFDALRRIACTFLAVLYLGVGGAMILLLRKQFGIPELVLFLVAVKCTDTGAYFVGSAVGRHKMIPWLSSGKSWEGLAGGLAVAAGASVLVVRAFGIEMSPGKAAAFAVAVGLFGQFGDLCESLLKRAAKVKDSGALVPEFGGVLDIVDSPLIAAPVAYVLLTVLT